MATADRPADELLRLYLKAVELKDGVVSMTLTMPGAVVTGEVISFRAYLAESGDVYGVESIEVAPFSEGATIGDVPDPEFLHMRNARFYFATAVQETGQLFRARVADVSGFAFGSITPTRR